MNWSKFAQGGTAVSNLLTLSLEFCSLHHCRCVPRLAPAFSEVNTGLKLQPWKKQTFVHRHCSTRHRPPWTVHLPAVALSCTDPVATPQFTRRPWGSLGSEFGPPAHRVLSMCLLFKSQKEATWGESQHFPCFILLRQVGFLGPRSPHLGGVGDGPNLLGQGCR